MIYIYSNKSEKSTNDIICWIYNYSLAFKRFNENDNNLLVNIKAEGNSFLFRKYYANKLILSERHAINNYLQNELLIVNNFIIKSIEQKPHIGNYFQRVPNKLWHLEMAKQAGLDIPAMLVTTQKKQAIAFKKEHYSIINKSIKDSFTGTFDRVYYYNHTERVSDQVLEDLDEEFFPTLFQKEIPKEYELRVIFVHEKIWAGAIMSQSDPITSLDWRNYNHQKPNRIVPYKLPIEIEEKIRKFAQLAGLNTGAIDMIVSKDKRYVFLECNPNGQISMVSEKCNYPIEKYIADFLANA